jgi:hypothetical protein
MLRQTKAAFYSLIIVLIVTLAYSCNSEERNSNKVALLPKDSTTIQLPHSTAPTGMQYIETKELGTHLMQIDFQVQATPEERELYEGPVINWISLDSPAKVINRLMDPDKIVLSNKTVILIIDYPVKAPLYFPLTSPGNGFSRRQLITAISQQYHSLYKEEEKTATHKTIPADQREGLINRNETNGKYGIWGHDLSDLDLSSIEVYLGKNGFIYLSLGVES